MKLARLVFNNFQENTYILSDQSGECVIVDAGNATQREDDAIIAYIEKNELKPVMLINTHGHIDHIVGINALKEKYGIPFAIHSDDNFLVDAAPEHGEIFGFEMSSVPSIEINLKGQESIKFGESEIKIIHTPGHAPGHVVLFAENDKILITGDVLFKGSIGRTDLPGGDYSTLMKSIISKVLVLGGDVNVYPGHGESTTIAREIESNPFITEVIEGEVNF